MEFVTVGHLGSNMAIPVDVVGRAAWLYVILAVPDRLMYVGETSCLVQRLSDHFGPYVGGKSTFRRAAARVGCAAVGPPFIVVAVRLPSDGDWTGPFDASSRKIRQLCEALVHANLAQRPGRWSIISTPQSPSLSVTRDIEEACASIANGCTAAIDFLEPLVRGSPFNLVVLGAEGQREGENEPFEVLLSRIEVQLHQWLVERLRAEYGERWWTEGVPMGTRVQCVSRREEEGSREIPREAYLTLIDLRDIIRRNWKLFGSKMERMTGVKGKERATQWLVELNEVRKLSAHPVKQLFVPVSQETRTRVQDVRQKLSQILD